MIKCQICGVEFKNYMALGIHIKKTHKLQSKDYYDKYIKKEDEGICLECGKKTNYNNPSKGYHKFCSQNCKNKSLNIRKKLSISKLNKSDEEKNITNEKRKKTNIEKYGVENPLQNKEIQEKQKQTNIKKYGVDNPSHSEEIKNKISQIYFNKSDDEKKLIQKKREITNIKNFGIIYYTKTDKYKNKIKKTRCDKILNNIDIFLKYFNLELLSEYKHSKELIKVKCLKCNTIFETKYNYIQQGNGRCPICFPKLFGTSKLEIELLNFIKSIESSEIIENSRNIISPLELDIYIPSKNIAIEFDGLYWHSEENGKDKNYHLNKTNLCESKNIQLIHIFEDEWLFKQDIVKSRLKQLLNLNNNLPKIYARRCIIKEISPKTKNEFLDKFHIQGSDSSNIKLGAFYKDELISVMTFSKGNISKGSKSIDGVYELSRLCSNSNYHIIGIASKLLSYFKSNYQWKEIYSYADRRWSLGNVYKKIGFELSHISKPNYFYIKGFERIHRFNLRKRPDEPKDITEEVIRAQEGYIRVYDCGHYKFKLINI